MASVTTMIGAAALVLLTGCATLSEPDQQMVMVQTIQDNRHVSGIGCVLSNDAGRWFVTSPGRVAVRKSAGQLSVDCQKAAVGIGHDVVQSRANASALIGNAVLTGGLGYLVDRRTGVGFDYPPTLTVLMRSTVAYAEPEVEEAGNTLY